MKLQYTGSIDRNGSSPKWKEGWRRLHPMKENHDQMIDQLKVKDFLSSMFLAMLGKIVSNFDWFSKATKGLCKGLTI